MRQRNAILEALMVFRDLHSRISVGEIIAFLYTCENEGFSVQELAFISGMSQSAASRNLRNLGEPGSGWALPPALGLIDAHMSRADGRSHVLKLTPEGIRLRDRLEAVIGRAAPIQISPEPSSGA